MLRVIALFLILAIVFAPTGARANVAYEFDITTAFAASDPFPNLIDSNVYSGDTGYLQIANSGPSAYSGIIRIVAISAYDGNLTFSINNGFIPAGGSVSLGMPVNSSEAGGFNSFTGSSAPSVAGTFRPGIILYMQGEVTDDGSSGSIKIAVQDLDITRGTILTDPNGFETDSFVLQGGDPFGLYNGDAWELNLPEGHYTFEGTAIGGPVAAGAPISEPSGVLTIALGALLLVRYRRRARKGVHGSGNLRCEPSRASRPL